MVVTVVTLVTLVTLMMNGHAGDDGNWGKDRRDSFQLPRKSVRVKMKDERMHAKTTFNHCPRHDDDRENRPKISLVFFHPFIFFFLSPVSSFSHHPYRHVTHVIDRVTHIIMRHHPCHRLAHISMDHASCIKYPVSSLGVFPAGFARVFCRFLLLSSLAFACLILSAWHAVFAV